MADLTVTGSQVVPATASLRQMLSAAATAIGDVVYESSTGVATKGDNSTAAKAAAKGLAVSAADAASQPIVVQTGGNITLGAGAAPVQGTVYAVSANSGKICPLTDVGSGKYVTILGVGAASNVLKMHIHASGVAVP